LRRAGFAGRGMTFAFSTEHRTLASDPDPRRSLGSQCEDAYLPPSRGADGMAFGTQLY